MFDWRLGKYVNMFNSIDKYLIILLLYSDEIPPKNMLLKTEDLINYAVKEKYLSPDYTLHGHRQVRETDCPGTALYNLIKSWPHFVDPAEKLN